MTDAAQRQLQTTIISGLLTVIGALGLLLWNNQQDVIKTMSDRISRLEVSCKVDWPMLPPVAELWIDG